MNLIIRRIHSFFINFSITVLDVTLNYVMLFYVTEGY